MNTSIIRFVLGRVLKIEGFLMLLPIITAAIYRETEGFWFFAVGLACVLIGFLMTIRKPKSHTFYLKEGCITTALCWIFMSLFGALPFFLSGEIPSFTDAIFETVSGFTTTGSSILTNVESLSHCSLIWRSFTHWIGGMGVLVFLLAIMPTAGGSNINLMKAESPGPVVGKLVPKMRHTARILYLIYIAMTLIEMAFLLFGNMPIFDALNISFGTAGTGGFAIKNNGCVGYTPYQQWVITIFMILFGINFNAYYLILYRHFKKAFSLEEVRAYLLIIIAAIAIIMVDVINRFDGFWTALRHSAFQVASIITTTGYATTDFNYWNTTSHIVLISLMFIGACAGSTGGGIKVSRIVIGIKTVFKEFLSYIHPKSIRKVKFDGKPIEHDVVRSINVYFITFMILFAISIFIISFDGKDLVTTFTAVSTTINNIGPGLSEVGPMGNFSNFSLLSKWTFIFDMLAGRLELFPMLLLFHPAAWRDMLCRKK